MIYEGHLVKGIRVGIFSAHACVFWALEGGSGVNTCHTWIDGLMRLSLRISKYDLFVRLDVVSSHGHFNVNVVGVLHESAGVGIRHSGLAVSSPSFLLTSRSTPSGLREGQSSYGVRLSRQRRMQSYCSIPLLLYFRSFSCYHIPLRSPNPRSLTDLRSTNATMSASQSNMSNDNSFGSVVRNKNHRDFDFTLLFA